MTVSVFNGFIELSSAFTYLVILEHSSDSVITLVKGPTLLFGGDSPVIQTSYMNNLNFTFTGYVWVVVHNVAGQTVFYSTSTIAPAGGGNETGDNVIFGLPPGTYYATMFVTSESFIAISNSTSFSFTI